MPSASVFICHASKDVAIANRIADAMEQLGIRSWVAPRSIRGGESYADAIIQGIRDSTSMIVLLTAEANESNFVHREVERAVSQSKQLIVFRLAAVMPDKGLELFLSSTQWIDAHERGIDEGIEALRDALLKQTTTSGSTAKSRNAATRRRMRIAALVAAIAIAAIASILYRIRSDQLIPKEPIATAAAVRAAARTGHVDAVLGLFTEQARSRQPRSRWQVIVAATHADLETATADVEIIVQQSVAPRAVGMNDGNFFVVQSQQPKGAGYLCEQVVLREEPTRWAAESYLYWPSASGNCVGKADLELATTQANTLLQRLIAKRAFAESDMTDSLQRMASESGWGDYSRKLADMLQSWQPQTQVIGAAPLPGLPAGNAMPPIPGHVAQIRYAVDKDGARANLDLFMQRDADGQWRLAGIYLVPNPS